MKSNIINDIIMKEPNDLINLNNCSNNMDYNFPNQTSE